MHEAIADRCPNRGRPPTYTHRHVIQDLMRAAETALQSKTVKETTIREIAAAAGTNEAMINYYFGGKEGLMIALLREALKDHPNRRADQITETCIAQRSIRPLVEALTTFYDRRPSLVRMMLSEGISGSSSIKFLFNQEYAADTPKCIHRIVNAMMEAGIYGEHCDVDLAAMSIMSMIVAPSFLQPFPKAWQMTGCLGRDKWIDHIASTIDLSARMPAH